MPFPHLNFLLLGSLFGFCCLSGVYLKNSGRPLNRLIFTFHKLAALAFSVLIINAVIQFTKSIDLNSTLLIALTLTGFCILTLFITGAFLSFERAFPASIGWIHKSTPIILGILFFLFVLFQI